MLKKTTGGSTNRPNIQKAADRAGSEAKVHFTQTSRPIKKFNVRHAHMVFHHSQEEQWGHPSIGSGFSF